MSTTPGSSAEEQIIFNNKNGGLPHKTPNTGKRITRLTHK
jgi:hypothetical protein